MNTRGQNAFQSKKNHDNVVRIGKVISRPEGLIVGKIVAISSSGRIRVDFPGNPDAPVKARSVVDISMEDVNKDILLGFTNDNRGLPIIIGRIKQEPLKIEQVDLDPGMETKLIINGERKIIQAGEQIELRCGKSSILMKKDGKVVIKGTKIVSRSSGANKVKGASVHIN